MNEELPEWMDLSELARVTPENIVEELRKYVAEAEYLKDIISADSEALALKEIRLAKVVRELIPELMLQLGTTEYKFPDKTKIVVNSKVKASISKQNEGAAFKWLTDNKYGGIIKSEVKVVFDREKIEDAKQLAHQLHEDGMDAALKQSIHPATLQSFVAERLKEGETIPDCFGIFEFNEAKITLPKSKK